MLAENFFHGQPISLLTLQASTVSHYFQQFFLSFRISWDPSGSIVSCLRTEEGAVCD